ncbi:MAG TPA: TAT-variant-translocated molybdopterin oxidoreductase [Lichenihabitans sp.]|jgi:molybdopterin-containing oxidoreductase family iron-sulfur binding subunit|nr:TAT-variant-translocated molybdopterin oxidoreductase [Lichenihabitans sp.]
MTPASHDLVALRAHVDGGSGPALWRSLDALAETPAFRSFLDAEFPAAARLAAGPDRRQFLRLMAASFAMAGLAACSDTGGRSQEVAYVRDPERIVPGAPLVYASATLLDGIANGVTVLTRNGRPLKIEGNDRHPWSRGGTDIFGQASILDLYDPLRSQAVLYLSRPSSWEAFRGAVTGPFAAIKADGGNGLRLLTGPLSSPSLLAQVAALKTDFPALHWHSFDPASGGGALDGAKAAFGTALQARWRFDKARVVVAIDGDFLDPGPHQVGTSRDWADARKASASGDLLTLHAATSTPTLTSAKADDHVTLRPAELAGLPGRLQAAIGGDSPKGDDPVSLWLARAAAALAGARGAGIVLAGTDQPAAVHEAVHRLNDALGNLGQTVFFAQPAVAEAESLGALVEAMQAGAVSTLVVLGANPVYAAPGDIDFKGALAKVSLKIHAGLHADETAAYANWHLPLAHPLESWGDARAWDGTVSLMQPTIAPLYGGRSAAEILSILSEAEPRDGLALLRAHWLEGRDPARFEPFWKQALIDGIVPDTAFPAETVAMRPAGPSASAPPPAAAGTLDLLFRPDPTVRDGAFASNAWLQELPKPLTKTVWENVIAISPALAQGEDLSSGDMVAIGVGDVTLEGPVWITPGQAPDTLTLTLGYGRVLPDMLFSGYGYDAYPLRLAASPSLRPGASLRKLGRRVRIATTQDHGTLEGHDFIRLQRPGDGSAETVPRELPSFYPAKGGDGRAWGMVIDEDACIGCNACVVACQAENNIPVVGKTEVALGREMHWLRIDRYYSGLKTGAGLDDPDTHFQPVPCMHCEEAPCEVGCPVEATLHDQEGLNLMVYNRCVGTRACSSYCPYKVRHFNYLDYTSAAAPSVQQQRNPEVTVRPKGVMEKCTYCVQRIVEARIDSDKSGQPIPDGTVKTACQGACPTRAITFGDLNDQASAVRAAHGDARNYALLGELGLKPRTTYLAERAPARAEPPGKEG